MDVLTPEQRHYNMSRIHAKNTKPELIVRKWLWHNGYRYRLHKKDLPGKPDIVLRKYQVAIFINGCFWHRHNCKYASTPQTRKDFWEKKLSDNVKRDRQNIRKLRALNWRVLIIWECEIKKWDLILEKKIIDFICVANDISVEGLYDNYEEVFYTAAAEEPDYAI